MRSRLFFSVSALVLLSLPLVAQIQPYSAVSAPEWDALFVRNSGWTGADGVRSIPRSGDERPGTAANTTTFWVFGDTFIGDVDENNHRKDGTVLVNNTVALLNGGNPDPAQIQFFWGTNASGAPAARMIPNIAFGRWFWPSDGIAIGGTMYLYAYRMRPGNGGVFNFAFDGVSLLTDQVDNLSPFDAYTQTNTPLYLPIDKRNPTEVTFGEAVMPNTAGAGAPFADGYLYIYGLRHDPYVKKLLVARVLPQSIANFSEYRYWDGRRWSRNIRDAIPIGQRLSSEFSVSPLPDGRFILAYQLDGLSRDVAVSYGNGPTGPFGPPIPIYRCPEPDLSPNIYTYNAKAHPHLSNPGELLISYNVNTFDFWEHFTNADIYRPRFIRLPLNQ